MKPASKRQPLALVTQASTAAATTTPAAPAASLTRAEKIAAAKAWLGPRHVLSTDYKPRVRVGFYLTAWSAEFAAKRRTEALAS